MFWPALPGSETTLLTPEPTPTSRLLARVCLWRQDTIPRLFILPPAPCVVDVRFSTFDLRFTFLTPHLTFRILLGMLVEVVRSNAEASRLRLFRAVSSPGRLLKADRQQLMSASGNFRLPRPRCMGSAARTMPLRARYKWLTSNSWELTALCRFWQFQVAREPPT
jgi:hypothetical protein